jgi:hypothetical protein
MLVDYIANSHPGARWDQIKAVDAYILIPWLTATSVFSTVGAGWAPSEIQTYPVLYCMVGGVSWALTVQLTGRANWLQEHLLRPGLVFSGIGPALPVDPLLGVASAHDNAALLWHDPKSPGRLAVWNGLLRFAANHAGTGTSTIFGWPTFAAGKEPPSHQAFAFQWTIIAGQAGAGKSRMAMECARKLSRAKARETGSRWRWRRILISEWCRRKWPWSRRHPTHPWDTGLIPASPSPNYLEALARWRPRRPTFLVLDDPRPDVSRSVVDLFNRQHQGFRYPVRLLIVDQVLPAELDFRFSDAANIWQSGCDGFHQQVFFLDSKSPLGFEEISRFAVELCLPKRIWWDPNNPQVRQFIGRMRGNALLIELGLRAIKAGSPIDQLDESRLLGEYVERIVRIVDAIRLGGWAERRHLHALAAATIAGVMAGDEAFIHPKESIERDPIHKAFGDLDPDVLKRLFNLSHGDVPKAVPSIRPEMIGDAFANFVIEHRCEANGDEGKLVNSAWRTNPLGVLRTLRRVAGRANRLAELLRDGPPENIEKKLGSVKLALAYASLAVRAPKIDVESGLASDTRDILATAAERIARLTPPDIDRLRSYLTRLTEVPQEHMVIRGWEYLVCMAASISIVGPPSDSNRVDVQAGILLDAFATARRFGVAQFHSRQVVFNAASGLLGRVSQEMGLPAEDKENWYSRFISELGNWTGHPRPRGSALVLQCELIRQLVDACGVETLTSRETYQRERVASWINLCSAQAGTHDAPAGTHDAAGCRASVAQVEEIVDRGFAGQPAFEAQRAGAWMILSAAQAYTEDVVGCRASLARVDEIVDSGFAGQPDFEEQRLRGWINFSAAQAYAHDAAGCRVSVARVDEIVDRGFAGQPAFEEQRATAWVNLSAAQACTYDVVGCRASVARVDEIVDRGFAGQPAFEERRTEGWINLIAAQADSSDAAGCRASVARVKEIVDSGFAGQPAFEELRAKAEQILASL